MEGIQQQSFNKLALRYGLFIALVPALYNSVLLMLNLHLDHNYYGEGIGVSFERATIPLMPIVLVFALLKYKKTNRKTMKLVEAFKLWVRIFLVTCVVVVGYNILVRMFVVPDFSAEFYEINRDEIFANLIDCCDYTPEELENHERTNGALSNTLSAFVFLNLVFGAITTLITGLIIRKRKGKTAETEQ